MLDWAHLGPQWLETVIDAGLAFGILAGVSWGVRKLEPSSEACSVMQATTLGVEIDDEDLDEIRERFGEGVYRAAKDERDRQANGGGTPTPDENALRAAWGQGLAIRAGLRTLATGIIFAALIYAMSFSA